MEALKAALERCKTLLDADRALSKNGWITSLAARWGLWDGFTGRPKSTAGLACDSGYVPERDEHQYASSYTLGRDLARK